MPSRQFHESCLFAMFHETIFIRTTSLAQFPLHFSDLGRVSHVADNTSGIHTWAPLLAADAPDTNGLDRPGKEQGN